MKGTIIVYNDSNQSGLISSEDGNRYSFQSSDILAGNPYVGCEVDFIAEENKSRQIAILSQAVVQNSKRLTVILLTLFFGFFGAHKFYMGYKSEGFKFVYLLLGGIISCALFGATDGDLFAVTMVLFYAAPGVIAFIELIIYATMSNAEFDRVYIKGRKGWF